MQKSYQLLVVLLFLLSAFGWGRLTRRVLDRRVFVFHSLTAIVGLAVLAVIGGVLNLIHLARTPTLLALVLMGVGVATRELLRLRPWRQNVFALESIPLFVAPFLALCAALLLMPSALFNYVDDFHTYITRVVRMAHTGTLAGNAFDSLGVDSLGSSWFFHGFFLMAGGVTFLHGFDAVACFALCLWFIAELSLRWRLPWWLGVPAVLAVAWINPQYVNISALYSGVAGVMALLLCGTFLARTLARHPRTPAWRLALTIGLLAAWLVTMKVTLIFFVAIYLAVLFGVLGAASGNLRGVIKAATLTGLTIAAVTLPWLLVTMPSLLHARNTSEGFLAAATMAGQPSLGLHESRLLFAPIPLYYGDTPVLYLALTCVALALGLAGSAQWIRHRQSGRLSAMPALGAAGIAMTALLFLNGRLFPIGTAIRYSCPVIIGGVLLVALGFLRSRTSFAAPARRWLAGGLAAGLATAIALFNGTLLVRLDRAMRDHTLLAYTFDGPYVTYCHGALTEEQSAYHRQIQSRIPDGATALVWSATPFHFDFERNRLLTTAVGGISNPALHFPAGLPPEALEQYFRDNGVQFVLFEKKGYGVSEMAELKELQRSRNVLNRRLGEFGVYLRGSLDSLASRGKILYSDERMLLFELHPDNPSNTVASRSTPAL